MRTFAEYSLVKNEKAIGLNLYNSALIVLLDYKAQIEFRPEEVNFRAIDDLLLSVIPKHLRRFFKSRWDQQYPNLEWKSNSENGEFLVSKLSIEFKTTKANAEISNLKTGHEMDWGVATIANILLDSHLQLVTDVKLKEGIETLIEIEKSFYEVKEKMECSFDDFKYYAGDIIVASKKVFDKSGEDEVSRILNRHEEEMKAVHLEEKVKGIPSMLLYLLNISGYYLNTPKRKRLPPFPITSSERAKIFSERV